MEIRTNTGHYLLVNNFFPSITDYKTLTLYRYWWFFVGVLICVGARFLEACVVRLLCIGILDSQFGRSMLS